MFKGDQMELKKVRRWAIQSGLIGSAVAALVAFQNCSSKNFSADTSATNNVQGTPTGPADGNGVIPVAPVTPPYNCMSVLQSSTFPAKLIFIVDVSGSNASNPGTDPNKNFRAGSIQSFFNSFSTKANFAWGFSTFANTSATAVIKVGTSPTISTNASDMQAAINAFNAVQDNGNTPYQAAIQMAKQTILNDPAKSASSKYMIVFMSDGLPNPDRSDSALANDVTDALSAAPGQVSFNTIYYGTRDNTAGNRMYKMAQVGGGQFLDINLNPQGKSFPISNVVLIPGVSCPAAQ